MLVVTTEAGYAPFEFLDENGNVVGLDASLAQALADDLGVELDIQNIAFDSVVAEVQAGNADMAIAGLTPNAERKQSVDMSDMYYGGGQCMLVLEENLDKYATKESLAGAVMATQKAALQETLMAEQFPDADARCFCRTSPSASPSLKNGECAAVLIDRGQRRAVYADSRGPGHRQGACGDRSRRGRQRCGCDEEATPICWIG